MAVQYNMCWQSVQNALIVHLYFNYVLHYNINLFALDTRLSFNMDVFAQTVNTGRAIDNLGEKCQLAFYDFLIR